MTSLSSKQNRKDLDMNLITHSRLPPPYLQDYHHRHLEQHIPGHPMIFPVIQTNQDPKDGAVWGVDNYSENCRKVTAEVQTSTSDYDNLVPAVRLDPIAEDLKGGDSLSINNLCSANSTANKTHDTRCVDKLGTAVKRGGGDSSGGFHSSQQYKTADDHSDCRSCGCKTGDCGHVNVRVVVKEQDMGNVIFSDRDESASNIQDVIDASKCENEMLENVRLDQQIHSVHGVSSSTASSESDNRHIDNNIEELSELSPTLVHTGIQTRTHENIEGKIDSPIAFPRTKESGSHPTATKTINREKGKMVSFADNTPDSKTTREEKLPENEFSCSNKTFSATSQTEKDSQENQMISSMKERAAFVDSDRRLEHSQRRMDIYSGKKPSRVYKTSMATVRGRQVSPIEPPIIVITPSTPKTKPPKSSPSKKSPPDYQGRKQKIHRTHSSKIVEKQNEIAVTGEEKSKNYNASFNENNNVTVCNKDHADELISSSTSLEEQQPIPSTVKFICDMIKNNDKSDAPASAVSKKNEVTALEHSDPPERNVGMLAREIVKNNNVVEEIVHSETCVSSTSNTATRSWTSSAIVAEIPAKSIDPIKISTTPKTNCGDYAEPLDTIKEISNVQSQDEKPTGATMEISHYTVIVSNNNTVDKGTPKVDENTSLTNDDADSLLESHYTVIPESSNQRVSIGSIKVTSDGKHSGVALKNDQKTLSNVKADYKSEAIYAIPIPKSQRKMASQQLTGSRLDEPTPKKLHQFAETELPPTPPRYPVSYPALKDSVNVTDNAVPSSSVQVTGQIKKSTTTDMLHSVSDAYDYANVPKYGRYDFFSLGRRPRHFSANHLTCNKKMAVSLEMLLRFRRESLSDLTSTTNTDQALSVDDILRSCCEFEQSNVFYRGRTSSDSTQSSSMYSLPLFGVNSGRFYDWKINDKRNNPSEGSLASRSFLKTRNMERKEMRPNLKINQDNVMSNVSVVRKLEDVAEAKKSAKNTCGISKNEKCIRELNESVKDVLVSPVTSTAAVFYNRDDKKREPLASQLNMSETQQSEQPNVTSNTENQRSREFSHPCCQPQINADTHNHLNNNAMISICSPATTEICKTQHGLVRLDSDYDTLEYSQESHVSPKSTSSPSEIIFKDYPSAKDDFLAAKDAKKETTPLKVSDSASFLLLPFDQASETLKETEIIASSDYIKSTEINLTHKGAHKGTNTQSFIQNTLPVSSIPSQKTNTPTENCQYSTPSYQTNSFTSGSGSGSSYSDPTVSSSYVTSPLSPKSVWSESTDDSSLGVFSPLSVDVFTEVSLEEFPLAAQKPPNYFAQLEAVEALKWLRAAGFPQYAQMFNDGQFPVDMRMIERDHDFLDQDSLHSLFRRLETLNKYAGISLNVRPGKQGTSEEDDEEDLCALSDRWEYKKSARRWSRKDVAPAPKQTTDMGSDQKEAVVRSGSHDSLLDQIMSDDSPPVISRIPLKFYSQLQKGNDMKTLSSENQATAEITKRCHDVNDVPDSLRLDDVPSQKSKSAKKLFGKAESPKPKKSRRQTKRRNIVEISGPIVEDSEYMRAKLERLNCVDISPTAETSLRRSLIGVKVKDQGYHGGSSTRNRVRHSSHDSSVNLNSSQSPLSSTPIKSPFDVFSRPNESLSSAVTLTTPLQSPGSDHTFLTSSSPIVPNSSFNKYSQFGTIQGRNIQSVQSCGAVKNTNSDINLMEVFLVPQNHQPGRFPEKLQNGYIETESDGTVFIGRTGNSARQEGHVMPHHKTGSMLSYASKNPSMEHRVSVYDNILPVGRSTGEDEKLRMIFPGIYELGDGEGNIPCKEESGEIRTSAQGSLEVSKFELAQNKSSKYDGRAAANISLDSSLVSSTDRTYEQVLRSSDRERSVSFETSSSSRTPAQSTIESEAGISSSDDRSSRSSTDSYPSQSRSMCHSSSLDSYFRGSSSHSDYSAMDNIQGAALQREYDDFDQILQQLYQNINDLSDYIGKDKQDPRPSHRTTDSMRLFGVFNLDQENSFSGGEGSNTAESSSEDPELVLTDLSNDDSLDHISDVSRERRDSGVGHSLPRASSERRRKKIRWHSFQKSHRPDLDSRAMQINSLTVCQMVRLQKLCLVKLTGIMEKCLPINRSGWNWILPRFMKRQKNLGSIDRKVFGVSLSAMAQRTGQPLPQCVLYAMRYLRRTSPTAVGIFRKSGVKSKIQQLRDEVEAHPDAADFEGVNAYNVADMLKTYFRDLPECLLTNKMSEIFRSIYMHVPEAQRLEAIQTAIVLLPDENREVLQSMLLFLSDISTHEADHQMNASNLAVCFTPTVFQLAPRQVAPQSPKRSHKNPPTVPDPREIMEQKAAHECLLLMITECKKLFTILPSLYQQLQVQSLAQMMPSPLQDIDSSSTEVRAFGQERIQIVLKEAHDRNRGWLQTMTVGDVEVFHRKPLDDCPLKEWKLVVEVEAPPIEVLHRIMHERHLWDEDLLSWSVVKRLDPHSDIFQFVLNSMAPHPFRHFCMLRYWRSDLNKGACVLVTMSVEHDDVIDIQGLCAIDLGSYFLMEPCGSGRSRLTYITRVDTRGRTPEWYTRIFGHICANFLERLRESFRHITSGPETRV